MAAIRQCVACNRQIPETWNSCQCGRVLTETRTIAGKRFSDYRAELYTRLVIEESKKQARKKRTKGSRAAPQGQQRERTRLPNLLRGRKRRKRTRPSLLVREQTATAVQNQREYKQTHETAVAENVSPAETSKQAGNSFTSALAEINKRLQNQSKLWACLASGLPLTSANT
ncbi:unnamed protein product [Porites evermanni]|uniref:Uncharacterized protein n=1 Tax=Porites evermanni TaxID=104178 RepID=A0ABN8LW96_9CNID|nr:unnamed protein product [Porites evermanni]